MAKLEVWVTKLEGWVAKLEVWVTKLEGWVAKLVVRLLVTASSIVSNPDIPKRIKNGRYNQRSGQHTL